MKRLASSRGCLTSNMAGPSPQGEDHGKVVKRCVLVWRMRDAYDLRARFELGQILNTALGHPNKRQKYGKGVVRKVADDTGLTCGAISLMRWFGTLAEDFSAFEQAHPNLRTWSAVREKLAKLKGRGVRVGRKPSRGRPAVVARILRSMQQITAGSKRVKPNQLGDRANELREAIEEIVRRANELGLSVSLAETTAV